MSEQHYAIWLQNAPHEPVFVNLMKHSFDWMKNAMPDLSLEEMRQSSVIPDKDANYDGGIHIINLSDIEPMVAHPGNPNEGIPSDPTNGALIVEIGGCGHRHCLWRFMHCGQRR